MTVTLLASLLVIDALSGPATVPDAALERASHSMSNAELGLPFEARPGNWAVHGSEPCEHWTDCDYADENGVAHTFYNGRLAAKYQTVTGDSSITALNIGDARNKAAVIEAADRFLNGPRFECIGIEQDECFVLLEHGTVQLYFDKGERLTAIRLRSETFGG